MNSTCSGRKCPFDLWNIERDKNAIRWNWSPRACQSHSVLLYNDIYSGIAYMTAHCPYVNKKRFYFKTNVHKIRLGKYTLLRRVCMLIRWDVCCLHKITAHYCLYAEISHDILLSSPVTTYYCLNFRSRQVPKSDLVFVHTVLYELVWVKLSRKKVPLRFTFYL